MTDQMKVITASGDVPGLGPRISESRNVLAFSLQPTASTMKNRHETPATTPQFGCNALMHSQMRNIMSSRGACFVSNSVYFCLLLPPLIPRRPSARTQLCRELNRELNRQSARLSSRQRCDTNTSHLTTELPKHLLLKVTRKLQSDTSNRTQSANLRTTNCRTTRYACTSTKAGP